MTRRHWAVCLLPAVLALLPGCAARADPPRVAFTGCPAQLATQLAQYARKLAAKVDLGCGQLTVPLDYAAPDGEQIKLQLIRARHHEQHDRIGSLVFHPGGPGFPGVEYTPYLLSWLPESVLERFDVISLDPRGTGGSAPINCPAPPVDSQPAPNVLTESGFARAVAAERRQSKLCLDVLGSRARYFTTQAAARDVDRLRAAVGDEELTFLGLSYGAKLGAEYAHQFPVKVRAAVLDGPSEPSSTLFDSIVRSAKGFEESFDVYARGCPSRPACQLGNPRTFVTRLVTSADATPIPSRHRVDKRAATGADVLSAVRNALYDKVRWADLDEVLYDAGHFHIGDGVLAMAEAGFGPPIDDSAPADPRDANYVINCNDSAVGPTDDQIRTTARTMARDYPLFGSHDAFNLFVCKTWQPDRAALEAPTAATRNPLLVVGTIHDAATPYVGAVALTKILGNATLLTWEGDNHTAMAYSGCVADAAARYLIDLTLPAEGTRCPP